MISKTVCYALLAGTIAMCTGVFGKFMSQHELFSAWWIIYLLGNIICTVIMLGFHSKAFYYSSLEHYSTSSVILLNSCTNFIETGVVEMWILPQFKNSTTHTNPNFLIWSIGITFILIGLHFILKSNVTASKKLA